MTRIQVHPDELEKNARLLQQSKQQLGKIVYELDKTMYLLQSEWTGVTSEKFFWDFMNIKESVFPSTLGLLSKFQDKIRETLSAFKTADYLEGEMLQIPDKLEPNFAAGLIDKAIGDTVTGIGETIEAFIYNPFSTLGSLGYDLTVGKIVDVGRGIGFAWDTAWGTGTARSDIEQFVNEQKKQLGEDESGYYKGAVVGQALSYFLFGKALHSNDHHGSGGSNGSEDGKKEDGEGKGESGRANKTHVLESVIKFEDQIRNKPVEHGQFFDKDGKSVGETVVGTEKSINITNQKDTAKDTIFTHNHPTNGPFSLEDIATAVDFNMAEIRAVSPNGTNLSMKRGVEGWKENSDNIGNIFANVQKELRSDPKAQEFFKAGNKDAVWDMLFTRVAEKIGGEYTKN